MACVTFYVCNNYCKLNDKIGMNSETCRWSNVTYLFLCETMRFMLNSQNDDSFDQIPRWFWLEWPEMRMDYTFSINLCSSEFVNRKKNRHDLRSSNVQRRTYASTALSFGNMRLDRLVDVSRRFVRRMRKKALKHSFSSWLL